VVDIVLPEFVNHFIDICHFSLGWLSLLKQVLVDTSSGVVGSHFFSLVGC
jgi:hypothetical protein